MKVKQNPCLMTRKPISIAEIEDQIDRRLELVDIGYLVGRSNIVMSQFSSWKTLMMAYLDGHQWWLVTLHKEDLLILIDTQGYNYPRYVGILSNEAKQKLNSLQTNRGKQVA